MVRFIMQLRLNLHKAGLIIYIPIWLDLLCGIVALIANFETDLHSNMVRFIILSNFPITNSLQLFTFQYG